jgi:hypothetical protein
MPLSSRISNNYLPPEAPSGHLEDKEHLTLAKWPEILLVANKGKYTFIEHLHSHALLDRWICGSTLSGTLVV